MNTEVKTMPIQVNIVTIDGKNLKKSHLEQAELVTDKSTPLEHESTVICRLPLNILKDIWVKNYMECRATYRETKRDAVSEFHREMSFIPKDELFGYLAIAPSGLLKIFMPSIAVKHSFCEDAPLLSKSLDYVQDWLSASHDDRKEKDVFRFLHCLKRIHYFLKAHTSGSRKNPYSDSEATDDFAANILLSMYQKDPVQDPFFIPELITLRDRERRQHNAELYSPSYNDDFYDDVYDEDEDSGKAALSRQDILMRCNNNSGDIKDLISGIISESVDPDDENYNDLSSIYTALMGQYKERVIDIFHISRAIYKKDEAAFNKKQDNLMKTLNETKVILV